MSELKIISGAEMMECLDGIGKALYDLGRLSEAGCWKGGVHTTAATPVAPMSPHDALRQLMDAVDALRAPDADQDRARVAVIAAATAFVAMSRGQFTTPQPRENH